MPTSYPGNIILTEDLAELKNKKKNVVDAKILKVEDL